ncbi:iron ABC transporter permease [Ureaplasma canigenitalium]|uniref:iron ABC transporter permease n=1 Tax=Ureaplasma canigenitalium TaxID=42092 RepID=UPI000689B57C|nr:iron ABC transporter permease [Ureaplasma canigenitalium]
MLSNIELKTQIKKKWFIPIKYRPLTTMLFFILAIGCLICLIFGVTIVEGKAFTNFSQNAIQTYKVVIQLLMSGMALGTSSYIIQRLSKNRFADVSIMGIGAINLLVFCCIGLYVNFNEPSETEKLSAITQWIFIPVSLGLTLIYYLSAKSRGVFNFKKLLMFGVILSFFLIAVGQSIKSFLDYAATPYIEAYIHGGAIIKSNVTIYVSLGFIVVCLIFLAFSSYNLQLITINQQIAKQLGVKVNLHIALAMVCIGIMVGASYALSGDFVYVGLLAGNVAMRKRNNNMGFGIFNSGFFGAISTLLTYFIAVNMLSIDPESFGTLVPLIIGPYFIYQVIKG